MEGVGGVEAGAPRRPRSSGRASPSTASAGRTPRTGPGVHRGQRQLGSEAAARPPPRAAAPPAWRPRAGSASAARAPPPGRGRPSRRHHPGEAGGHVLADAVADHRRGRRPPGAPQPARAYSTTNSAGWAKAVWAAASAPRRRAVSPRAGAPQVEAELGAEDARRSGRPLPEDRLLSVEPRPMPGYCAPWPGKRKATGRSRARPRVAPRAAGSARSRRGVLGVAADDGAPAVGKAGARPAGCRRRRPGRAPGAPGLEAARPGGRPALRGPFRCGPRAPGAARGATARRGSGAGASSSTTWALVPPMPKRRPRARGGRPRSQGAARRLTKNGLASKSISGFGSLEVEATAGSPGAPAPGPS
jgi:hypothetical protein